MTKRVIKPNVVRGGRAVPLGNNFYYMQGRKHKNGGIDVGKDLEVEGGEVMQMGGNSIRVFSSVPFLNGKSPARLLLAGANPNKVFAAQENYKDRHKLNDDGSKRAKFGGRCKAPIGGDFLYWKSPKEQKQAINDYKKVLPYVPFVGAGTKVLKGVVKKDRASLAEGAVEGLMDYFGLKSIKGLSNIYKGTRNVVNNAIKSSNNITKKDVVNVGKKIVRASKPIIGGYATGKIGWDLGDRLDKKFKTGYAGRLLGSYIGGAYGGISGLPLSIKKDIISPLNNKISYSGDIFAPYEIVKRAVNRELPLTKLGRYRQRKDFIIKAKNELKRSNDLNLENSEFFDFRPDLLRITPATLKIRGSNVHKYMNVNTTRANYSPWNNTINIPFSKHYGKKSLLNTPINDVDLKELIGHENRHHIQNLDGGFTINRTIWDPIEKYYVNNPNYPSINNYNFITNNKNATPWKRSIDELDAEVFGHKQMGYEPTSETTFNFLKNRFNIPKEHYNDLMNILKGYKGGYNNLIEYTR